MRNVLSVLVVASLAGAANADLLAGWSFENYVPGPVTGQNQGPIAADSGIFAAGAEARGFHAATATTWSNPVGNGSSRSFSSNTWTTGDYYQVRFSTVGYTDIVIDWQQTRSATGPQFFNLVASTDGGTTFFSLLSNYSVEVNGAVGGGSWSSTPANFRTGYGFNVAGTAALANQADVIVRMVANSQAGGTGGTGRIDDVNINGTLIPTPGSLALLGLGGLVAARRRR
ncbi:MAG: hypothetical protein HRU70_14640 [Phycisphaeraceae bacterium]|nr:MAG: hypothetical protein HRU70_14640 [Phycisphaeraceae bacterium]